MENFETLQNQKSLTSNNYLYGGLISPTVSTQIFFLYNDLKGEVQNLIS